MNRKRIAYVMYDIIARGTEDMDDVIEEMTPSERDDWYAAIAQMSKLAAAWRCDEDV